MSCPRSRTTGPLLEQIGSVLEIGWFIVEQQVEEIEKLARQLGVTGLTRLQVGVHGRNDYTTYYLCRPAGLCHRDESKPVGLNRSDVDAIIMAVFAGFQANVTMDFGDGAACMQVDFGKDGGYSLPEHCDLAANTVMTVVNQRSRLQHVVMAARAPFG